MPALLTNTSPKTYRPGNIDLLKSSWDMNIITTPIFSRWPVLYSK